MAFELTAAEANREFYRDYAARYDEVEVCAASSVQRQWLRGRIGFALRQHDGNPVRVLDAGGGTGNAAQILVECGLDPTVVDISPEMLERWAAKAVALGRKPQIIRAALEDFFDAGTMEWNLVVFSSVLHHLEDPGRVLIAAARCLTPGGVILTVHDPISAGRAARIIRRADWITYAILHDRTTIRGAFRERLRHSGRGECRYPHVGRTAERHALTGLDDKELADGLRAAGFELVEHQRLYEGRHAWCRWLFKVIRRPTSFSLIARRPPPTPGGEREAETADG